MAAQVARGSLAAAAGGAHSNSLIVSVHMSAIPKSPSAYRSNPISSSPPRSSVQSSSAASSASSSFSSGASALVMRWWTYLYSALVSLYL